MNSTSQAASPRAEPEPARQSQAGGASEPAGGLRRFQDAFVRALLAADGAAGFDVERAHADGRDAGHGAAVAAWVASLARQPGFAVYCNTVLKGCIDALQANYPTVARLVGDEFFRAAAAVYVRENLPSQPMLMVYGDGFADFLATFEPVRELPYLAAVARLDRFWTEAHVAADAAPLAPDALAGFDAAALQQLALRPHPSARWAHFPTVPAFTIWSRNRAAGPPDESPFDWRGEGALVFRPRDVVRWTGLAAAGCAFLDACAAGRTLGAASEAALAIDPNADLAALGASLFAAGAFATVDHAGARFPNGPASEPAERRPRSA